MEYETIIISGYPKVSSNKFYAGVHWTVRKKIKDEFEDAVLGKIRNLKKYKLITNIQFRFFFKKRALDADNCQAMAKMFIDTLRKEERIANDSNKYIVSVTLSSENDAALEDHCIIRIEGEEYGKN